MARHGGGSYYAQGSPAFVGGAMAGAAIGEAIRTQADFNDCMSASGWVPMAAKNKTEMATEKEKIKAIGDENRMCLATARANPKYAPILAYLSDLNTQRYTLSQMADMSLPTEEEAKLLAALGDESTLCWSKEEQSIGVVEPGLLPLLSTGHRLVIDLSLRLVQRQISWGQYSKAVQDINEQAKSGRMPTMPVIAPTVAAAS